MARRAGPTAARRQIAVSTWLRLLKIKALFEREVRRALGDHLTLAQFDVLNQLARRPSGFTGVELTRQLLVTAGNLTGIVDRLEREGLVRRVPHPADRRAIRLTLTRRGRRVVRVTQPVHHRAIARLMGMVPQRDVRRLRALLGRLHARLELSLDGAHKPE